MNKQTKIDNFFKEKVKSDNINKHESNSIAPEEFLLPDNMTLEQFAECTNVEHVIKADLRKRVPNKLVRRQLYIKMDKHVAYVYNKLKTDPDYRKRKAHIFKTIVIAPRPWVTSKDRELMKKFNIEDCYVDMCTENIVQDMAEHYMKKDFPNSGEDLLAALQASVATYINKKFKSYVQKKRTFKKALLHLRCKYGSRETREILKRQFEFLRDVKNCRYMMFDSGEQIEDAQAYNSNVDFAEVDNANKSYEFNVGITPLFTSTQKTQSQLTEEPPLATRRDDCRTNIEKFTDNISEESSKSEENNQNDKPAEILKPSQIWEFAAAILHNMPFVLCNEILSERYINDKFGKIMEEKKEFLDLNEIERDLANSKIVEEIVELMKSSKTFRDVLDLLSLLSVEYEGTEKITATAEGTSNTDNLENLEDFVDMENRNSARTSSEDNSTDNNRDKNTSLPANEDNEDLSETRVSELDALITERGKATENTPNQYIPSANFEELSDVENRNSARTSSEDNSTDNNRDKNTSLPANEDNEDLSETRVSELDALITERGKATENTPNQYIPSANFEELSDVRNKTILCTSSKDNNEQDKNTTLISIGKDKDDPNDGRVCERNISVIAQENEKARNRNIQSVNSEETPDLSPTLSLMVEPISRRKDLSRNIQDNRNVEVNRSKTNCLESISKETINFDDFRKKTNIEEFIYADIMKKYPDTYKKRVAKMEKIIKKFYDKYIKGKKKWPNCIYIKSNCDFSNDNAQGSNVKKVPNVGSDVSQIQEMICKEEPRIDFGGDKLMVSSDSISIYQSPTLVIPKLGINSEVVASSLCGDPLRDEAVNIEPMDAENITPSETRTHLSLEDKEIQIVYFTVPLKDLSYGEEIIISKPNDISDKQITSDKIKEEFNHSSYDDCVEFIPNRSPEPIVIPDEEMDVEYLLEEMFRSPKQSEEGPYGLPPGFIGKSGTDSAIECSPSLFSSDNRTPEVLLNVEQIEHPEVSASSNNRSPEVSLNVEQIEQPEVLASNVSKQQFETVDKCHSSSDQTIHTNALTESDGLIKQIISNLSDTYKSSRTDFRQTGKQTTPEKRKECMNVYTVKAVVHTQNEVRKEEHEQVKTFLKRRTDVQQLKHLAKKRPKITNNDDLVPQKTHNFDPLQLIRKTRDSNKPASSFQGKPKIGSCQNIVQVQDVDFLIEDASQVLTSADKTKSPGKFSTSQLLNTDNTYFTSSQLAQTVINENKDESNTSTIPQGDTIRTCNMELERSSPIPVALVKTTDLQNEFCQTSETIIPDSEERSKGLPKLIKKNISAPQFGCITYLSLHQVTLNSKSNQLMYESSVPFLQSLEKQPMQATINFRSNGFRQLNVCGESLRLLLGLSRNEWSCFQYILGVIGTFRYRPSDPEPSNKSLPHRVLYYLFKTLPKFTQVTYKFEDSNINIIKCVKLNCTKPMECITAVLDPAILEAMENLKKAGC